MSEAIQDIRIFVDVARKRIASGDAKRPDHVVRISELLGRMLLALADHQAWPARQMAEHCGVGCKSVYRAVTRARFRLRALGFSIESTEQGYVLPARVVVTAAGAPLSPRPRFSRPLNDEDDSIDGRDYVFRASSVEFLRLCAKAYPGGPPPDVKPSFQDSARFVLPSSVCLP